MRTLIANGLLTVTLDDQRTVLVPNWILATGFWRPNALWLPTGIWKP